MSDFKRYTNGLLDAFRAAEVYYSGIKPNVFSDATGRRDAESLAFRTNKKIPKLLKKLPKMEVTEDEADRVENLADHSSAFSEAVKTLSGLIDPDDKKQSKVIREIIREASEIVAQSAAWNSAELHKNTFANADAMTFKVRVGWGKEDQEDITSAVGAGKIKINLPHGDFDPLKIVGVAEYGVYASHFMHDVLIKDALEEGDSNKAAGLAAASLQFINHMLLDGPGDAEHKQRMTAAQFVDPQKVPDIAFRSQDNGTDSHVIIDQTGALSQWGDLRALYEHLKDIAEKGLVNALHGSINTEENVTFPQIESISQVRDGVWKVSARKVTKPMSIQTVGDAISNVLKMVPGDDKDGKGDGDGDGLAQQIIDMVAAGQGQDKSKEPQDGAQETKEEDGEGEGEAEAAGEESDDSDAERQTRMIQASAGNEAAQRLNKLLGLEEEEVVSKETPIHWTELIHARMMHSVGLEKQSTWLRPNRRFIGQNIYLPGFRRRRVRRIASGIDESGSIDMPKLMAFNEEQMRVIDKVSPEGWDIFHFSTEVVEENLTHGEMWEAKRMLNGGTDFSAAYRAIQAHIENGQQYDAILFFTDLYDMGFRGLKRETRDAHGLQDIDFYWITWGKVPQMPEFGTLINMDTNEIVEID